MAPHGQSVTSVPQMGTKQLSLLEAKQKAAEYLRRSAEITDFSLHYAELEGGLWKVDVEFTEEVEGQKLVSSALLALDARTGKVVQYKKGYRWRF